MLIVACQMFGTSSSFVYMLTVILAFHVYFYAFIPVFSYSPGAKNEFGRVVSIFAGDTHIAVMTKKNHQ